MATLYANLGDLRVTTDVSEQQALPNVQDHASCLIE